MSSYNNNKDSEANNHATSLATATAASAKADSSSNRDSGHEGTPSPATPDMRSSSSASNGTTITGARLTSSPEPPALPPRPLNLPIPPPSQHSDEVVGTGSQLPIANSYSARDQRTLLVSSSSTSSTAAASSSSSTSQGPIVANEPRPRRRFLRPLATSTPSSAATARPNFSLVGLGHRCWSAFRRGLAQKYVTLCTCCGCLIVGLGAFYLAVYFILMQNTTAMHYFETMPTYVPSIPLFVTGILIQSFARKKNRNTFLMKFCGLLCLACAVLCVVVTVTTTVVHMNRLQTLRECVYHVSTTTCTCFAGVLASGGTAVGTAMENSPSGLRFAFTGTPGCDVIHGVLYSCLRALFGVSVIGILICIFSSMLVYQLVGHEKKKQYWAQLESRCRHLQRRSRQVHHPHHHLYQVPHSLPALNQCECCTPNTDISILDSIYCGTNTPSTTNFYSPNPATGLQCQNQPTTMSSFRNWLRRSGFNLTGLNQSDSSSCQQQTADSDQQNLWRRSNPLPSSESSYGFHTTNNNNNSNNNNNNNLNGRIYPSSCHLLSTLSENQNSFLWIDPPPPYSQQHQHQLIQQQGMISSSTSSVTTAVQTQAIQTSTTSLSVDNLMSVARASQVGIAGSSGHINLTPRTTKSGLLPNQANSSGQNANVVTKNYCNSLPSRQIKHRKRKNSPTHNVQAKSVANIPHRIQDEEEKLMQEVREKLNALLLYKCQNSKASKELMEVRSALAKLQSASAAKASTETMDFYEQRLNAIKRTEIIGIPTKQKHVNAVGRNRNSTSSGTSSIENKYETIEKSLSPYKIEKDNQKDPFVKSNVQVSIRKQLLQQQQQHQQCNKPSSPASKFSRDFIPSSLSSQPPQIHPSSISPTTSFCSLYSSSSHYAQISPLRGAGRPTETSATYFQEICGKNYNGIQSKITPKPPIRNDIGKPGNYCNLNLEKKVSNSASNLNLNGNGKHCNENMRFAEMFRSDPKLNQVQTNQNRPLQQQQYPLSVPTTPEKKIYPVFLRPEQNIPDIFAISAFQPIGSNKCEEASRFSNNDGSGHRSSGANGCLEKDGSPESKNQISRDDIVVTVRSAQV